MSNRIYSRRSDDRWSPITHEPTFRDWLEYHPGTAVLIGIILVLLVLWVRPSEAKDLHGVIVTEAIGNLIVVQDQSAIDKFLKSTDAFTKIEIVVEVDGTRKDFTLQEFKRALGFDSLYITSPSISCCVGIPPQFSHELGTPLQ
jgi:hypothetical protein